MEIKNKTDNSETLTGLVSIGLPVFNDIKFLKNAIKALLAQSYTNFELIISDDCSTDGSSLICKEVALKDSRIKYIRQERNIGISRNMEFLLKQARGKYFMWAGNDDSWDKDFIKILKYKLDEDADCVSSFCAYTHIDESGTVIPGKSNVIEDYDRDSAYKRIKALIKKKHDSFGYGLFRREKILGVRFPVWWGVNKKCAYNNIYPTLCFYLAKGRYSLTDRVLWYKRMKSPANINHKFPFPDNFFLGYLAFVLRKFNLVYYSCASIIRARPDGMFIVLKLLPNFIYSWFLFPIRNPFTKYRIYKNEGRLDFFV